MFSTTIPTHGTFSVGRRTAVADTVIVQFVPPQTGDEPLGGTGTVLEPLVGKSVARVTTFCYNVSTTAHTITVMRPLNYTTFSADAAASQAIVNLTADPGLFQTAGRYRYPLPNGRTTPSTGNNGIAGNDYVVYQAAAGQWVLDTVSSVSGLAVTLATNLPTGGVLKGGLLYFFGITTDTDPATNAAHQALTVPAASSGTVEYKLQSDSGLWAAYHPGDPLIFHSNNATAAGTINLIAGHYSKH